MCPEWSGIGKVYLHCKWDTSLADSTPREAEYEGEIDPHTPLFINITYTKKRPSFRQNSWCAKGRMVPCLGVLIRPTVGDLFLLLSILSWHGYHSDFEPEKPVPMGRSIWAVI